MRTLMAWALSLALLSPAVLADSTGQGRFVATAPAVATAGAEVIAGPRPDLDAACAPRPDFVSGLNSLRTGWAQPVQYSRMATFVALTNGRIALCKCGASRNNFNIQLNVVKFKVVAAEEAESPVAEATEDEAAVLVVPTAAKAKVNTRARASVVINGPLVEAPQPPQHCYVVLDGRGKKINSCTGQKVDQSLPLWAKLTIGGAAATGALVALCKLGIICRRGVGVRF